MATIIFSNMGDVDTAVLKNLWNAMPEAKVVEITKFTLDARQKVDEAIAQETDLLVMCGHGTPEGLINPNFVDRERYLIDRHNKNLIKADRIVGIWCHAKQFAERYGLRGFFSSMFISNLSEAYYNHIYNTDSETITYNEHMFCLFVNFLLRTRMPQERWINILNQCVDFNDPVIKFNYNGLAYFKEAPKPAYQNDYWYNRIMGFESKRWNLFQFDITS